MSILLLIVGLLLFVGLIVFHEFGHFIAARRNGVEVEEFGIGFPPRAKILARKNGTIYSLNWLPLGGFVKLKGENDDATEPGSYGAAPLWAKVKIMVAGVLLNLVAAFLLLTLSAAIGLPKLLDNQFTVASDTKVVRQDVYVAEVGKDSPAEQAGLKAQDKLVSITPVCTPQACPAIAAPLETIKRADDVQETTKALAGLPVTVEYIRDGQTKFAEAKLRGQAEVEADKSKGYLGIAPAEFELRRSTWSSPIVAAGLVKQFTQETFKGLGRIVSNLWQGEAGKASNEVSGPVGVFFLLKDGTLLGPEFIIFVIAVISLTLAIMNLLPIPALDGGRLFITLIFRALKKPLTKDTEEKIHGLGFLALMVVFVLITIVDVRRFF